MVRICTVYIIENFLATHKQNSIFFLNCKCYKQKKCGWLILTNFVVSCIQVLQTATLFHKLLQRELRDSLSFLAANWVNVTIIADYKMGDYTCTCEFLLLLFFCILGLEIEILWYFIFFMFLSTEKFLGTLRKENRKSMAVSVAILVLFVLGYLLICSWTILIQNKNSVNIYKIEFYHTERLKTLNTL